MLLRKRNDNKSDITQKLAHFDVKTLFYIPYDRSGQFQRHRKIKRPSLSTSKKGMYIDNRIYRSIVVVFLRLVLLLRLLHEQYILTVVCRGINSVIITIVQY